MALIPQIEPSSAIRGPTFEFDFKTWRPVACTMGIRSPGFSHVVKGGSGTRSSAADQSDH
jgi:hypothetical protein